MADITITINDNHVQRALDAICFTYDYDANSYKTVVQGEEEGEEDEVTVTESRPQFAKRMLARWIRDTTLKYEKAMARKLAGNDVEEIDAT